MERKKSKLEGNFVLDSSVVIKWFSQEEFTNTALNFRDGFVKGNLDIAVLDLQLYEVANALRYNKDISKEDIHNAVNSLIDLGINIIVPTKSILKSSIKIALDYDISIYDASFVALAKEIGYTFVTADEKLFNKIKELDSVKFIADF